MSLRNIYTTFSLDKSFKICPFSSGMTSLTLLNENTFDDVYATTVHTDNIEVNDASEISVNDVMNFTVLPTLQGTGIQQYIRESLTVTGALSYSTNQGLLRGITIDNYNRDVILSLSGTTVLSADLTSGTGQSLVLYMNYSQTVGSNKALAITPTNTSQTILSTSIPGNTTSLIATFEILQATLNQTFIPSGIFDINLFTAESNANDGLEVYAELYTVSSLGVETLFSTTDQIEVVEEYPSFSETTLSAVNVEQEALEIGGAFRMKIYGVNGRGSAHTLYTYYEGTGAGYSHLHTPFNVALAGGYWSENGTTVYLTNTGNNVAIGKLSATQRLEVSGNILTNDIYGVNASFTTGVYNNLSGLSISGTNIKCDTATFTNGNIFSLTSSNLNASNLYVNGDSTFNGDIFIGTANPGIVLSGTNLSERVVLAQATSTNDWVNGTVSGDGVINVDTNRALFLQNGSTTNAVVIRNNRLGINRPSPSALLDVNGSASFNGGIDVAGIVNVRTSNPALILSGTNLTTRVLVGQASDVNAYVDGTTAGDAVFSSDATKGIFIQNGHATNALVITSNRIGLNTRNPLSLLDVNGTLNVAGLATFTNAGFTSITGTNGRIINMSGTNIEYTTATFNDMRVGSATFTNISGLNATFTNLNLNVLSISNLSLLGLSANTIDASFIYATFVQSFTFNGYNLTITGRDFGDIGGEVQGRFHAGFIPDGNYVAMAGTRASFLPGTDGTSTISFYSKNGIPTSSSFFSTRLTSQGGDPVAGIADGRFTIRSGSLQFQNNAGIRMLTMTGGFSTSFNTNLNISGALSLSGPLVVSSNATFLSGLSVSGALSVSGPLTVSSNASFLSNITANNYRAKHWTGSTSTAGTPLFYRLATFGTTSDTNNAGGVRIHGQIGGWLAGTVGVIDLEVSTRNQVMIGGTFYSINATALSSVTSFIEFVLYIETNNTYTLYMVVNSQFSIYDFMVSCNTSGVATSPVLFDPTTTAVVPTGSVSVSNILTNRIKQYNLDGALSISGNMSIGGQYSRLGVTLNASAPMAYSITFNRFSMSQVDDVGTDGYLSSAQYDALATSAIIWTEDGPNKNIYPQSNDRNLLLYNTDVSGSPAVRDTGVNWRRTTLSGDLNHFLRIRTGGVKDGYLIHQTQNSAPFQLCAGSVQPALLLGGTFNDLIEANTAFHIKTFQNGTPNRMKLEMSGVAGSSNYSEIELQDPSNDISFRTAGNSENLLIRDNTRGINRIQITPTTLSHAGTTATLVSSGNTRVDIGNAGTVAFVDFNVGVSPPNDFDCRIAVNLGTTGTAGASSIDLWSGAILLVQPTVDSGSRTRITNTGAIGVQCSPSTALTVSGNIRLNNTAGALQFTDGNVEILRANNGLEFQTNNTTRITITQAGNVSIGTTFTSLAPLVVGSNDSNGTDVLSIFQENGANVTTKFAGIAFHHRNTSGNTFKTGAIRVLPNNDTISQSRLAIQNYQNSTLFDAIQIDGGSITMNSRVSNANFGALNISGAKITLNRSSTNAWSTSNIYINGETNNNEFGFRIHPNSDGNLYLDFRGTGKINWRGDNTTAGTTRGFFDFGNGYFNWGTTALQILNDGQLSVPNMSGSSTDTLVRRNPTNSILTIDTCDRRIKKNFRTFPDEYWLNKIMDLKPQMFDLHPRVDNGKQNVMGFIAQDLQEFDKNLVGSVEYMINKCDYCKQHCLNHPDGECEHPERCECLELRDVLTVNQLGLLPYITGAIQGLIRENNRLREELVKERIQYKTMETKQNNRIGKLEQTLSTLINKLEVQGIKTQIK